jgi:periplasmic divalent cation tolerance protein
MDNEKLIHIHWTCGSLEEARRVARYLVQEKLVACANIFPWVESVFLWKDQLDIQQETKVIFKTREEKFDSVKKVILENAKYEVPEILKIPISGGNQEYIDWVMETTK